MAVSSIVHPTRDQDLLDTLKTEHDEVKVLLLQAVTGSPRCKSLVRQVKSALVPHTKAEEKVLYAALVRLRDKDAQTDGQEGNGSTTWRRRHSRP
jgi:hypothetical protein